MALALSFLPAQLSYSSSPSLRQGIYGAKRGIHSCIAMSSSVSSNRSGRSKIVWIWTESRQVMTAAVERGWNTFVFPSEPRLRDLAKEWSSIALMHPLFFDGNELLDQQNRRVAVIYNVYSPEDLAFLQSNKGEEEEEAVDRCHKFPGPMAVYTRLYIDKNRHLKYVQTLQGVCRVRIVLGQPLKNEDAINPARVIPAENIVAAFQGCKRSTFAVSKTSNEAQVFLEALEQGFDGVVLKVEDMDEILKLKSYFDRRNEAKSILALSKANVTSVEVVGMGDRVCVDLCSLMRPGEGLLVGSFARGLFLVHSECLETNYIAARPFRVNAGPVHAYVAVPGGKTCYLSELQTGKEVIVVDQAGSQRTAVVGRVKVESRPLILVEAKEGMAGQTYNIFLQNAETVGLVCPFAENKRTAIPVTSLKVGDEVMLRVHGGARHTGIEIQEFILEK